MCCLLTQSLRQKNTQRTGTQPSSLPRKVRGRHEDAEPRLVFIRTRPGGECICAAGGSNRQWVGMVKNKSGMTKVMSRSAQQTDRHTKELIRASGLGMLRYAIRDVVRGSARPISVQVWPNASADNLDGAKTSLCTQANENTEIKEKFPLVVNRGVRFWARSANYEVPGATWRNSSPSSILRGAGGVLQRLLQ